MIRDSAESKSTSSSASKEVFEARGWGSESVRGGRDLPYGEARCEGSRRSGCRKPETGVKFGKMAESLSDFSSSRRVHWSSALKREKCFYCGDFDHESFDVTGRLEYEAT